MDGVKGGETICGLVGNQLEAQRQREISFFFASRTTKANCLEGTGEDCGRPGQKLRKEDSGKKGGKVGG